MQSSAAMPASDLVMIEALTASAFELAEMASEMAKAAGDDIKAFLALAAEFRHLSFAIRMSIRLKHAQPASAALGVERPERMEPDDRPDSSDSDTRLERLERERDRDYEPVSLDRFLASLRGAARRAERHGDALPAHIRETTLPTLKGLLAQVDGQTSNPPRPAAPTKSSPRPAPAGPVALLSRPPPATAPSGRASLLNSAGAIGPSLRRPGPS